MSTTSSYGFRPTRLFTALIMLAIVIAALYIGFDLLRAQAVPERTDALAKFAQSVFDNATPAGKLINGIFAILLGVGGMAALFWAANGVVEELPETPKRWLLPYVFVGPMAVLLIFLYIIPTIRTVILSFYDRDGEIFVGLQNYIDTFTVSDMWDSFRNTILWIVLGTFFCVSLGLLIATLADRSKFETVARAIVFMPMAISFVGAAVIFRFIYYYAPEGSNQIGLLNAIVTTLGGEPQAWLQYNQPWNNLWLIIVVVWMQTGFCMVIFSAALKGVPEELLEAGRIDGATELRIFFNILLPYIWGTIVTVTTTIIIFMLKIFDLVMGMTGGQFSTEVIGTQFYRQLFANRNIGWGAAIATLLLIAVIPVMAYNLRQLAQNRK